MEICDFCHQPVKLNLVKVRVQPEEPPKPTDHDQYYCSECAVWDSHKKYCSYLSRKQHDQYGGCTGFVPHVFFYCADFNLCSKCREEMVRKIRITVEKLALKKTAEAFHN